VNDVMFHGYPDDRPLEASDIVNLDVTVYLDGFHGDTSSMFFAGRPRKSAYLLCEVAERARDAGIAVCGPGVDFREIGKAIQGVADEANYDNFPMAHGHGIGSYFHGRPQVEHVRSTKDVGLMRPGMTFTIEPVLIEQKNAEWEMLGDDPWIVRARSAAWSAQFEHTILITDTGHQVLTGPSVDYKALAKESLQAVANSGDEGPAK